MNMSCSMSFQLAYEQDQINDGDLKHNGYLARNKNPLQHQQTIISV